MVWRFKRADFRDNTHNAVQRMCRHGYAVAISKVDAVWRPTTTEHIWALFADAAASPASASLARWSWLRQIPGARPVSRRSRVRRDIHFMAFRIAGGQPQCLRRLKDAVLSDRVRELIHVQLALPWHAVTRCIKQGIKS